MASRLHRAKTFGDHVINQDATSGLILFIALCSHVDHKQVKHSSYARRMLPVRLKEHRARKSNMEVSEGNIAESL